MKTIEISADDKLIETLEELARAESKSVETLSREVLSQYARRTKASPTRYSFIGIGRSGKGDLSTSLGEALAEGAHKRRGWSLRE